MLARYRNLGGAIMVLSLLLPAAAVLDAVQEPAASGKPAASVINLNTATASELQSLPGVGAKTAARIVEYRQKQGGFKKIEELMNVRGIGEKNFLKLKSLVTVVPPKTERAGTPSDR